MSILRDEKFKVDLNLERQEEDASTAFHYVATVEFMYDSNTYGNGHHMGIYSGYEPFGFQSYDIRYDKEFDRNNLFAYVVKFYLSRFNGKDGKYRINKMRIIECEDI